MSMMLSTSVMASPAFVCPSEGEFVDKFTAIFKAADLLDTTSHEDQAAAYFSAWPSFIPNQTLFHASFEKNGTEYDLVGVKGSYIGRSGYLDAYTVVFEKGASTVLATIQTDTDRSTYRCSESN